MDKPILLIITLFIFLFAFSCQKQEAKTQQSTTHQARSLVPKKGAFSIERPHPYDLQRPTRRFVLPADLMEVSALTYVDETHLAMVQDEKGKIFIYDIDEEEVQEVNKFAQKGDYEGIEIVNGIAYALQSDGDVFEIKDYLSEDPEVEKFENKLRTKNDTEGLGYDKDSHSLLIACKSSPHLEEASGYKGNRAVYAFDLRTKELQENPFILVSLDSFQVKIKEGPITEFSRKVISSFGGELTFRPSGIAQHPMTGQYWIISSVGKTLAIVEKGGEIVHVERLRPGIFNHPEGICFAPDGTLYISNEGDDGVATILMMQLP
ncbi:MAG: hypothetical protein AB8F95_19690 [Bacteroidia bacterium]